MNRILVQGILQVLKDPLLKLSMISILHQGILQVLKDPSLISEHQQQD